MNDRVDMQVQSTYSDGEFSPTEIVAMAKGAGLAGVVLTDHGTIRGVGEFVAAAAQQRLATCEGIEINGTYQGTGVHILGYGKHFDAGTITSGLEESTKGEIEYNSGIADRLRALGIADIDTAEIVARKGIILKIDILRALVSQTGMTMAAAKQLTSRGGAAHVPYSAQLIDVIEAVTLIRAAGGLAVLSHPGVFFRRTPHAPEVAEQHFWQMLDELIAAGMRGIEARSGRHTAEQVQLYEQVARDRGLIITGGSDFHGSHEPDQVLGKGSVSVEEFKAFVAQLP